jgi:hypothetical protein
VRLYAVQGADKDNLLVLEMSEPEAYDCTCLLQGFCDQELHFPSSLLLIHHINDVPGLSQRRVCVGIYQAPSLQDEIQTPPL